MNKTVFLFLLLGTFAFADNSLLIKPSDLRLEPEYSGNEISGYHLFVKKIPGLESVMLTETTKDPSGKSDNYAYRAKEYNKINGDEIRFLNGKKLESEYGKYSLIDSSAEKDSKFGEAFHIYIPLEIEFGYPWSRNGSVKIHKGTFINLRGFDKKYGDYSGNFYDNPYMFNLGVKKPKQNPPKEEPKEEVAVLTDDYNPIASEKFKEVSEMLTFSKGPETIVQDIMDSLKKIPSRDIVDVVFVIDATGSMKDDIEKLRKEWVPELIEGLKEFKSVRLGLTLYRDYGSNFKYNNLPVRFFDFTSDVNTFTKNLNGFKIKGNEGGDIPEAVYEGLYAGLEFYKWNPEAYRKIILIGDAEPHPVPRGTGKYSKSLIESISKQKDIKIDAIITPDEKDKRGR